MTTETPYQSYKDEALAALGERAIVLRPTLFWVTGDIPSALILGQLLFWDGRQKDKVNGWIRKVASELEEETCVTERQQERIRPALVALGVIEFKMMGIPAMPHYRIVGRKIKEIIRVKMGADAPTVGGNLPNTNGQTSDNLDSGDKFPPKGDTNTEITTESTPEYHAPVADAPAPPSKPPQKAARRPSGFGTLITEHTDERVSAYLFILKPEISAGNADLILRRIHLDGIETWRDVLTTWAERGYNRTGFADMFERYDTLRNQKRVKAGTPPKTTAPRMSDEQYAELEAQMEKSWA